MSNSPKQVTAYGIRGFFFFSAGALDEPAEPDADLVEQAHREAEGEEGDGVGRGGDDDGEAEDDDDGEGAGAAEKAGGQYRAR